MNARHLTPATAPADFLGMYGPNWRQSLISEHLDLFRRAGGTFRPGNVALGWAVVDGKAYPVVCSEIVRIDTEDGPVSGRCGTPALARTGTCEAHDYSPCDNHIEIPGQNCPTCDF